MYAVAPAVFSVGFSGEVRAIKAQFTTPATTAYLNRIERTIALMKSFGLWEPHVLIYDGCAETEQQSFINWKSPGSNTLTKAGTVAFEAKRGWTPAGTTADGLQTGYNPSSMSETNIAVSVWSRTTTVASTRYDWGNAAASMFGRLRITGDTGAYRVGNTAQVSQPTSVTDTIGLWSSIRAAAASMLVYKNGAEAASASVTDQAIPSSNLNIGSANIGTTNSTNRQLAMWSLSRSRSAEQEASYYQIWLAHLKESGAA